MKTIPNPLYAKPVASRKMGDGRSDIGRQEIEVDHSPSTQWLGGREAPVAGGHPSSISQTPSTDRVQHERPKRFVYGQEKKAN
jgi:hypothetical protein